jgi:flagellar assembly protein FliH
LSKIFHAESNVAFQSVRFADLENAIPGKKGFFVPLCQSPVSDQKTNIDAVSENSNSGTKPEDEKKSKQAPGAKIADKDAESQKKPAQDIEALKNEAYMLGKKEGRAEAEKKMHSATQALAEALEQISHLRRSILENSKDDMIRLIMAVSERVIRARAGDYKEMVVDTVKGALESAVEADEYYIRVNPEDLKAVKEREPLFLAAMKGLQNIYFTADENITRGGCIAESRAGDVDATIETQLAETENHLRKAMT